MFSSRSVPLPRNDGKTQPQAATPDYTGLVRFLVLPFLESPESLKVDCEISPSRPRAWIRLAFEGEDKGRVFGRGGRNIQAIRTALEAAALAVGQSVYLDIYGGSFVERDKDYEPVSREAPRISLPSKPSSPKSSPRLRSQEYE